MNVELDDRWWGLCSGFCSSTLEALDAAVEPHGVHGEDHGEEDSGEERAAGDVVPVVGQKVRNTEDDVE